MEEKKKSCSRNNYYNKESHSRKMRFEDEKEYERIFSRRQEKHFNDTTEKEQRNFQKQSHNKSKASIHPESKTMVCKFLRQAEEKPPRMRSNRLPKEDRNENVKNDAYHQSINCNVEDKFLSVNEADANRSSFNQNISDSHSRSMNQSVNISKELSMRSNVTDKLSRANGDSSTRLSEVRHKNNDSNISVEFSSSQNNCAYSGTTYMSVMSNAVDNEFNQSCEYDGHNLKFDYQNGSELSNNLPANDVYPEQKVNSAYGNSVTCNSVVFTFCKFELEDLLHYNANLMQDKQVFEYAFALRDKIMQRIGEFKKNVRDELEFLCALSDGNQTEKNQKLIIERTCHVIKSLFKKSVPTNNLATPAKESKFFASSSLLMPNDPESNRPRVQDIPITFYPQADNYICGNYSPQAPETTQRCDFPLESNGENIGHVTLDKNVHTRDDRLGTEKYTEIQDSHNNDAYENGWAVSAVNDSMENSAVLKKYVAEHGYMPISSKETEYSVRENTFSSFKLPNLLQFDIDTMQGDVLFDYAVAVKQRVLKMLPELEDPIIEDKLEFMCEITDGSQTERNQKVITERMCNFISEYIKPYVPENIYNTRRISRFSPKGKHR